MKQNYRNRFNEIQKSMANLAKVIPDQMTGFSKLHEASIKPGSLDSKTKELIALGIAITVRCDGCIAFHVHDALEAGASKEEITETIGVAILMGGGPAVVYGSEALDALEQFGEARVKK